MAKEYKLGSKTESQKLAVGTRVMINEKLSPWKKHFRSGEPATILYSYAQECNNGMDDGEEDSSANSYGVMFDDGDETAWYDYEDMKEIPKKLTDDVIFEKKRKE